MLLLVILEVYTHLCWRQMLFWKHCSPTCQLSFIYNHQPGNTPINGLCLPGLWWLSKTCIKLLFLTAGADDCVILFFLPKWKNESRQWGWSWQHGEKSWSLINNLKISTGFGVWGKPNSCRDECLLDAWCYFTRVHSIIFFYFNKEWMPSFLCRGAFLSNEPERVCLGICFKSHLVSARS